MPGHRFRGGAVGASVVSLAVLAGVLLAGPAAASKRPDSRASGLTPIIECSVSSAGVTKTIFGYDNHGSSATVAVGPLNGFSPGPMDRGQPTSFVPGTRINVFTVADTGQTKHLTWSLGGQRVHAPGPPCASSPVQSSLASWGPVGAIISVTVLLGGLLFWRTRRLRTRAA
jgi:hypothetical protein